MREVRRSVSRVVPPVAVALPMQADTGFIPLVPTKKLTINVGKTIVLLTKSKTWDPGAFRDCGCQKLLDLLEQSRRDCVPTLHGTATHERITENRVRLFRFTIKGDGNNCTYEIGEKCFEGANLSG